MLVVELKDGTKAKVLDYGTAGVTVRPLHWTIEDIDRMGGSNNAFIVIGWDWIEKAYDGVLYFERRKR